MMDRFRLMWSISTSLDISLMMLVGSIAFGVMLYFEWAAYAPIAVTLLEIAYVASSAVGLIALILAMRNTYKLMSLPPPEVTTSIFRTTTKPSTKAGEAVESADCSGAPRELAEGYEA